MLALDKRTVNYDANLRRVCTHINLPVVIIQKLHVAAMREKICRSYGLLFYVWPLIQFEYVTAHLYFSQAATIGNYI